MHVLPQLRKLEHRYPTELQVISVHSPKFPAERESDNLRRAILRLRIEHPVINDRDFLVWTLYSPRAWPTLIFLDPEGRIIGRHSGEIDADAVVPLVEGWLAQYRERGLLAGRPLDLVREHEPGSGLSFPGKVEFDPASGRLFVADSNHDRIVIADVDGNVERVIGGRDIGRDDGPPETATFNQPQGLALADGTLYIADLENHLIRRLDLSTWDTTTVAGTGEQLREQPRARPALEAGLSSPWDVAHHDGTLYVAMAGIHQIWALDLTQGVIEPWAGTFAEGIVDGPRDRAELAQPSGLAVGREGLTFADSESSAVREVSFAPGGGVRTFVGSGLFDFGDIDGPAATARLQHPLDIAWLNGDLYVADSLNHKIKRIDPASRDVSTVCGGEGDGDGALRQAGFREPAGLCAGPDGSLIVADTDNHAIRLVEPAADSVRTIALRFDPEPRSLH